MNVRSFIKKLKSFYNTLFFTHGIFTYSTGWRHITDACENENAVWEIQRNFVMQSSSELPGVVCQKRIPAGKARHVVSNAI
jgi:hypothetical protein